MPADPRKRQKKQERRAAKRKSKQHELARVKHAGLPERLDAAARYPVLHSWVTENLWDQGLGWVCLSRELPNGSVAFAVFLVDRSCLGVKDVATGISGRYTYDNRIVRKMRSDFTSREVTPACARKFVESAVAYAEGLGLHAHADYQRARLIFGDIDPGECTEELEFGKDGKPYFVAGPYDTPDRCRRILKTLEQSCGHGGYNFLIPMSSAGEVFPGLLPGGRAGLIDMEESDSGEEEGRARGE